MLFIYIVASRIPGLLPDSKPLYTEYEPSDNSEVDNIHSEAENDYNDLLQEDEYQTFYDHPLTDETIPVMSEPVINARSALVMDFESGTILYEKNARKRPMAN